MKCGNCHEDHATVAQVRDCYGVGTHQQTFVEPAGPFRPLSEKQYNYINKLRIQRGEKPDTDGYEAAEKLRSIEWAKYEIGRLLAIPKTAAESELEAKINAIPEGRYAVDSLSGNNDFDFYKVDKPTSGNWAGSTFVKMIVGGHDDYNVKGARKHDVLKAIAEAGHEQAAFAYSVETNRCSHCDIHLTKYASRKLGKGYTCAAKRGQGGDWLALQHKWEADEKAGLHSPSESDLEHMSQQEESAADQDSANEYGGPQFVDHPISRDDWGAMPPMRAAVDHYLGTNDIESATWK